MAFKPTGRRRRFSGIEITGVVFLLLTLLMIWMAVKNFWIYSRMRSSEMTVLASALRVELIPGDDREEPDDPDSLAYILTLDLRANDGSGRQVHWVTDAGKAAYPEEALDELASWRPGTRHRIQMIRGDSRNLRIEGLADSPELERGFGGLLAAMMFGMIALGTLAGATEEHVLLRRFNLRRHLGVWMVFFGFGAMPLIGCVLFTYSNVHKMWTWQETTARRIEQGHKFDLSQLPPEVQLTPAAKAKLDGAVYDLLEYEWSGRKVHGGIGALFGVHDLLKTGPDSDGTRRIWISPRNRWELSDTLGWKQDFWIPFGVLLFFGVTFCAAGLFIRKTSPNL
jgi:hypothetical protein